MAVAEICEFWRNSASGTTWEHIRQLFQSHLDPELHSTKLFEQFIATQTYKVVTAALRKGSPATPEGLSRNLTEFLLQHTVDHIRLPKTVEKTELRDDNLFVAQARRRCSDFDSRIQRWLENNGAVSQSLDGILQLLGQLSAN